MRGEMQNLLRGLFLVSFRFQKLTNPLPVYHDHDDELIYILFFETEPKTYIGRLLFIIYHSYRVPFAYVYIGSCVDYSPGAAGDTV